jgi:LL-diaminopimelate aminotransferase
MSDPYIQNLFAERIGGKNYGKGTAVYKFAKIKSAKRAALAANPGAELIDMGVGEPDEMAFPDVIDELYNSAKNPANRGYADNGGLAYQQAAARWMKNVCGVEIADPANQIIHSIGSKAALSILPTCFINPGDVALMTTPGYPVFGTHSKYSPLRMLPMSIRSEAPFSRRTQYVFVTRCGRQQFKCCST